MKLSILSLVLAGGVASGKPSQKGMLIPDGFKANSEFGRRLLSKAKQVVAPRRLDQDREAAFIGMYDIKYLSCSSLIQINPEEGGGGGNGDQGVLYTQHLVRFGLCPEDQCQSCSGGGEYVVNMLQFIDAYTEAKMEEQEQICENIRENCYCNNNYNDDQMCENECYVNAGQEVCIEYEGEEEFEIQRYLECAAMENQNGNNNNNNNNNNKNYNYYNENGFYGQYYIGPYCSKEDGKSIYMGVFYDQGCVNLADSTAYSESHYGQALPFSEEPIVTLNECMSCKKFDENNNNNGNNNNNQNQNNNNNQNGNNNYYYYNQNYEISELCQQSYERAARCESSMDIPYPDTSGCDYIHNILPRLSSASRSIGQKSGTGGNNPAAITFSVLFAFTTVMFGAYAYFLYRKIKRGSVNLSSADGNIA